MPQADPKVKPPARLAKSTLEILRELEREAYDLRKQFTAYHDSLRRSYAEEIKRQYLSHFVLLPERPAVWDAGSAAQEGVAEDLFDSYAELTDAIVETDEDTFEDELEEALEEGFDHELWLLAQGGLDAEVYADELPEDDDRTALLLAAGVGGLSWAARMRRHQQVANDKMRQWLLASIYGGRSLEDTLGGVDHIAQRFDRALVGLFENEHYRAHGLGAEIALAAARQDREIVEVWVTREDNLVCPICEALHLTITPLQPVTDSHPACRCRKIPIPDNYRDTPIEYTDFLRRLGRGE